MKKYFCMMLIVMTLLISGCGSKMKDGFYTAEMSDYSFGWKEYLCILVKDGDIVYAEFNAKDPSGYIKSWDNAYMENMGTLSGTYPNEYTRYYVAELIESQNSEDIDTLTGATTSGSNFTRLAAAVTKQAVKGKSTTIIVESEAE